MKLSLLFALCPLLGAVSAWYCCDYNFQGDCTHGTAQLCCRDTFNLHKRECSCGYGNLWEGGYWEDSPRACRPSIEYEEGHITYVS